MLSPGTLDVKQRNTIENHLTRLNNDTTDQEELIHKTVAPDSKKLTPAIQTESLALELADTLNDHKHLSLYLSLTRRYPESALRSVLSQVLAVPENKIRKSRAALFIYLIQAYAKQQTDNPSH